MMIVFEITPAFVVLCIIFQKTKIQREKNKRNVCHSKLFWLIRFIHKTWFNNHHLSNEKENTSKSFPFLLFNNGIIFLFSVEVKSSLAHYSNRIQYKFTATQKEMT